VHRHLELLHLAICILLDQFTSLLAIQLLRDVCHKTPSQGTGKFSSRAHVPANASEHAGSLLSAPQGGATFFFACWLGGSGGRRRRCAQMAVKEAGRWRHGAGTFWRLIKSAPRPSPKMSSRPKPTRAMGEGTACRRCGGGCAGGAKSGGAKCGSDWRAKSTLIAAGRSPFPNLLPRPTHQTHQAHKTCDACDTRDTRHPAFRRPLVGCAGAACSDGGLTC